MIDSSSYLQERLEFGGKPPGGKRIHSGSAHKVSQHWLQRLVGHWKKSVNNHSVNLQVKYCPWNKLHHSLPGLCSAQRRGNVTPYRLLGQGLGAHLISHLCSRLERNSWLTSSCVSRRGSVGHRAAIGASLPSCTAPACYRDVKIEGPALTLDHLNANFSFWKKIPSKPIDKTGAPKAALTCRESNPK